VNFYKHHLGDYDGHTAHLTWDEDMAYTRLLRAYYRREKGIPDSEKYRLARAVTKAHKGAVDRVLAEFFTKEGDEWRQKRCDEEIQTYQAKAEKNREVGKLGGRPRETQMVSNNNPEETQMVPRNNPSQNQIPEPEKEKTLSGKPDLRSQAVEILNFLNAKTGKSFMPVPANLEMIVARLKEGYPCDDIRSVVARKCGEWKADEKMAEYLRPKTLFSRTNFANYHGQLAQVSHEK
jgi:uncharacterized phage protein (TIGR02220 family)